MPQVKRISRCGCTCIQHMRTTLCNVQLKCTLEGSQELTRCDHLMGEWAYALQAIVKQLLRPFKPGEDRFAGMDVKACPSRLCSQAPIDVNLCITCNPPHVKDPPSYQSTQTCACALQTTHCVPRAAQCMS